MATIYWTIAVKPVEDGWTWSAQGVTEAGAEYADDGAGDSFVSGDAARQAAEETIGRKASLNGEAIEIVD
ncbi:hypothetical protein [Niveispirillum sp.]|uniref:hypothetical protein n=1 Tax=Niveispirillum sp. TaxID=1917217 RepID=UPI001B5FBD51|nr:hypothetical protein [Niveispirillum sp.]MBP7339721.1 hypothetical protein [Niveispirillum sp.]